MCKTDRQRKALLQLLDSWGPHQRIHKGDKKKKHLKAKVSLCDYISPNLSLYVLYSCRKCKHIALQCRVHSVLIITLHNVSEV